MDKYLPVVGRIFLAIIFVVAGINKISGYAGTQMYMDSHHVPGILLPLVIITELGGGIALILGWQTKIVALLLSGFCILSALIFHNMFVDPSMGIMFMKNLAMAGGFLVLAAHGPGAFSLDSRKA